MATRKSISDRVSDLARHLELFYKMQEEAVNYQRRTVSY